MMIYQYEEILKNYDIDIKQGMSGRNMMIFDTDKGIKALKEIKIHPCKIQYIKEIQEGLTRNNISVDLFQETKEGELSVEYDTKKYVFKDYYKGREINVNNRSEVSQAMKMLAKIHGIARGDNKNDDIFEYDKGKSLKDTLARHIMEMKRTRNRIRKQKTFSEFDIAFIECYETYFGQANITLNRLEKVINKLDSNYRELAVVIHGQFNHHSMIMSEKGKLHIVDFEYACTHYPIMDVYSFMRKVLEKNNWQASFGYFILDEYLEHMTLTKDELKLLYLLFEYPEKFWKICNFYLSLNKARKSNQPVHKLMKLNHQRKKKEDFLYGMAKRYGI